MNLRDRRIRMSVPKQFAGERCAGRTLGPPPPAPIRVNLTRIINLSVVIVRVCGRSSNHGKSGFGTAVPQRALRGLLDAPLEAGHDNPRGRRGKLKLAAAMW